VVKPIYQLLGGAAAVAAIGVGLWAWTPDRNRGDLNAEYFGAATRYLQIGGNSLRVRDTGPIGAPVLIFLHGFGSSLESWEPWAKSLSSTYRVVRFDFPGSGLSAPDPAGDYTDTHTLSLIESLMDQMGVERGVFVGNSMGGRIAWKFAAQFPARVSKLVLISPDGFASPGFEYGKAPHVPVALRLMKYCLPRSLLRMNLRVAYADPSRPTDGEVDRYYDLLLAPGNRDAMLARMQQTVLVDPVPILRGIETPTLLIWGEKDRMIPFANSADYVHALPHARLVSLPNLGHLPQEEAPAASLAPLEQFLAN
jgi:pimeloyl-ACP methyl ester carboxylesterase